MSYGQSPQESTDRFQGKWLVGFTDIYEDDRNFADTEAEARGLMWCWLGEKRSGLNMKKPTHTGFMDGDLSKPPKKLAGLYRDLLKDAGKPCESYDPDCCVCKAWAAYAELEDFYAI